MNNRKILLLIGTVLLTVIALGGLMSCEDVTGLGIEPTIKGVWHDDFGETVISATRYIKLGTDGLTSYACDIIAFVEDDWNAGESGSGNFGYFVIEFTDPPIWNPAAQDKFTIVRWENLRSALGVETVSYSEGYKNGTYFVTADAALTGETTADYFAFFSTVTK